MADTFHEGAGARLGSAPRDVLEALLVSVADAVYLVDPDGRVEFANPAALELLGYEEDELLGQISHPTIHHHHWDGTPFPQEECPMLAPRTTGETVREYGDTFWRKDGSKFRVAYSSAPLPTSRGRGAVVVFRDVTAHMAHEERARSEAVEGARSEEIRASRARIVAGADDSRRQLVRDLHDGAQQRLVRILLELRLARDAVGVDPERVATLLDEAAEETEGAIRDLRELGSGIHPQILTNRGIGAAVESLTGPLPLAVSVQIPECRYPADIEAAAYFIIAEALTNAIKHSGAESAEVRVLASEPELIFEVVDDGRGGAAPGVRGGLAGMADRVAVLDGSLEVTSPEGGGTKLTVSLPAEPLAVEEPLKTPAGG